MEYLQYIIGVLAVVFLCIGWLGVQFLAQKMKTKNHFDHLSGDSCGSCTCGGTEECKNNVS
jgi:hypothetical protein